MDTKEQEIDKKRRKKDNMKLKLYNRIIITPRRKALFRFKRASRITIADIRKEVRLFHTLDSFKFKFNMLSFLEN
jgi:hypothetical protein